jgi:hypothetical protein
MMIRAMMNRGIAAALAASMLALAPAAQAQEAGTPMQAYSAVKLRALDKITGNSKDLSAKVGESLTFGRLRVTVRACYQSDPREAPESSAFLEIRATPTAPKDASTAKPTNTSAMNKGPQPIGEDGLLFSGWMYASSPGISALEHPTYDVWVISCSASAP